MGRRARFRVAINHGGLFFRNDRAAGAYPEVA